MRWKTVIVIALVLTVALAMGLYVVVSTYDYDKLIRGLVKLAKESTGRELVVKGHATFKIGISPELVFHDVSFQNASWGSRPEMARAKEVGFKLALWPLLRGDFEVTGIMVDAPDILVEVDRAGRSNLNFATEEKTSPEAAARALDALQVSSGLLTYKDWRSGKTLVVRADRLQSLRLAPEKTALFHFQGAFNGRPLTVDGTIGLLGAFLRPHQPWPADLTATAGGLRLTARGEMGDAEHFKGLAFRLTAAGPSLAEAAASGGLATIPDLGAFTMEAELTDAGGTVGLEHLNLETGSSNSLEVVLRGSVGDITGLRKVRLAVTARSAKVANLEKLGAPHLPFPGAFAASGHISDPAEGTYRLENLRIELGKESLFGTLTILLGGVRPQVRADLSAPKFLFGPLKVTATVTGLSRPVDVAALRLVWRRKDLAELRLQGSIADLTTGRGVNLLAALRGRDLAGLEKLTGRHLPISGPFALSGQVTDAGARQYDISQLELAVAGNHLAGACRVDLSRKEPGLAATLSSQTFDLGGLLRAAGTDFMPARSLPDLGPLSLALTVSDVDNKPRMERLDLRAGSPRFVAVEVKGAIRDLSHLEGVDLRVTARGENVSGLEQIVGHPLPVEGAYALSGHLIGPGPRRYRVEDLRVDLGKDHLTGLLDLEIAETGRRVSLTASAPTLSLEPLKAGDGGWRARLRRASDLGPLTLTIELSGSGGHWSIEALDARVGSDTLGFIGLKGNIQDPADLRGLKLEILCQGKDVKSLEKLIGRPVAVNGAYRLFAKLVDPEPRTYAAQDLSLIWGESDLSGEVSLDTAGARPAVTAALSTRRLDLRPFLPEEQKRPSGEKDGKVFSSEPLPLDWLDWGDCRLTLEAGQLLLPKFALNDLSTHLSLSEGTLKADPFTFAVGGGTGECHLEVAHLKHGAAVSLVLTLKEVQVGPMLDELGYERNLEGSLDEDLKLSGEGSSVAELMAGLNGYVDLVMGNGRAAMKYLTVLNSDFRERLLRLINPFQQQSPYTDFNCFVNRLKIRNGLAKWKLLLDTEQTTIVAAGDIDLRTEQLDVGIKPSPKTGFGVKGLAELTLGLNELAKPLKLVGTLGDPSFSIDPVQAGLTIAKALGGFALLGPFGVITALADVKVGGKDACLKAIQKAQAQANRSLRGEDGAATQPGDGAAKEPKKKEGFWRGLFGE
jgi:uncharacterized protein involved in outer membrane biogenesis